MSQRGAQKTPYALVRMNDGDEQFGVVAWRSPKAGSSHFRHCLIAARQSTRLSILTVRLSNVAMSSGQGIGVGAASHPQRLEDMVARRLRKIHASYFFDDE